MEIKSSNRSQAGRGRMAAAQRTVVSTASSINKSTRRASAAEASLLSMKCKARSALFNFPDAGMNWHLVKSFAWSDGVLWTWRVWKGNKTPSCFFLTGSLFWPQLHRLLYRWPLSRWMPPSLPHSSFALSVLLNIWCRQKTINHPVSAGIWMPQPSDWCRKWNEHLVAHRHSGSASCWLAAFGKQNTTVAWWGRAEVIAGSQLIHVKWS